MFFASAFHSALLWVTTSTSVAYSSNRRRTLLLSWLGLWPIAFVLIGIFPTACVLHAILTGSIATICAASNARPRTFALVSLVGGLCLYGSLAAVRLVELRQLMREFPLESLEARLAYEPRSTRESNNVVDVVKVMDDRRSSTLDNYDYYPMVDSFKVKRRMIALEDLHTGSVRLFNSSPGFGVARILYYRTSDIPLPPVPSVPLPKLSRSALGSSHSAGDVSPGEILDAPPSRKLRDNLEVMHRLEKYEFANPLAFGYIPQRRSAAGFRAHALKQLPTTGTDATEGNWHVDFVELISLLKHAEPVAYVSTNLPRMDELRDAPIRPLDSFERDQLSALRGGGDIVAAQAPGRIRMLGALRAVDECLNCHNVAAGDLLGVFSYDLRRDPPH